jgi:hypothetical protein
MHVRGFLLNTRTHTQCIHQLRRRPHSVSSSVSLLRINRLLSGGVPLRLVQQLRLAVAQCHACCTCGAPCVPLACPLVVVLRACSSAQHTTHMHVRARAGTPWLLLGAVSPGCARYQLPPSLACRCHARRLGVLSCLYVCTTHTHAWTQSGQLSGVPLPPPPPFQGLCAAQGTGCWRHSAHVCASPCECAGVSLFSRLGA